MIQRWFLLLASLACYGFVAQANVVVFVILAALVVVADQKKSKMLCVITIALFTLGFVYFKVISSMPMLFGYSVFAFMGISFLVDQQKERRPYSVLATLVYLFFFPKMLAGPIVRAAEFIPQLTEIQYTGQKAYQGFKLVAYALFVKFIIADTLLAIEPHGGGANLLLLSLVWGIRFYLDFYAYSILAVGIALILGITLPYNFDSPYTSKSFKDFWQRWNLTLSSWLRDYIYIPLGGNRFSRLRTSLNILVTFIVSGLWHGVALPFILWGACHAVLVYVERRLPKSLQRNWLYRIFVVVVCMMLWQLFRFNNGSEIVGYPSSITVVEWPTMSVLITSLVALVSLLIVESQWLKSIVFQMRTSRRAVICEATFFALIITVLVLCPISYTFNFFYLNY